VRLRLADGRSFLFGHSREVEADAFDTRNGDAIYAFPVEPDPEGEKGHATEAWLVVTDATNAVVAAARADLGAGIDIGGGSHSLIPARHLAF
jgi:hypothetical protein